MATRVKLDTKGFAEYLEKITQAGQDVDAAAAKALDAGGDILLAGMVRRVPKDTHNLERHLNIDGPNRDGNFHYILVGLARGLDADTARYGNAQEYGTSSMGAKQYIRPALDEDMSKARKAMRQVFIEWGIL
jgi:HK97 gp10 family phage protein